MELIGELDWIDGRVRYAHMEYDVPWDEVEEVKAMSQEELANYLDEHGHLVIDDCDILDQSRPTNVEIC